MNTTLTPLKHTFLLATLALFLTGTGALRAGNAGIQDGGGFFSEAAKADAKGNITEVQRTLHKDILVESLAKMPDEIKNAVNVQDKGAVGRAYEAYVDKRAASEQVNGVCIFLVKDAAHLQVAVGNDTQKQAFTLADRDALVQKMVARLRTKDYDGALREGVAFVATTMRQHHGVSGRAASTSAASTAPWHNPSTNGHQESSGSSWGIVGIIIFLVIVFVVIRLIGKVLHMLFGGGYSGGAPMGGAPMGGYGGGYGGGGGGFLRSLMGGMLGGAAGSWMYDSFFGSRGSSSYGAPPSNDDQSGGGGGYNGQDSSFSSSGSDVDSGGGGGGGDFGGGGDSGGGGGDSGGGGDF